MRFSLINPPWDFEGSIYFGCREPHLPLEFGYSKALLEKAGHAVQIVDAQMDHLSLDNIRQRLREFTPDFTVLTTAPSYLFWRCAPPELRIPQTVVNSVRDICGTLVVVGPHASTAPKAALKKLDADVAVLGECEEILPRLAGDWASIPALCYREDGDMRVQGGPHASNMNELPVLRWDSGTLTRHRHHHHRFDHPVEGPGAEMEATRGCPYHCTFCAKDNFRNLFRRRPLAIVAEELDGLIAAGAQYVYFIDEIFLPHQGLLETIASRGIRFGIQTRIDLWSEPMIDLLGRAGCVSVEAGVESITEAGRQALDKKRKLSTEEITSRLIFAKQRIPFVQANLMDSKDDDPADVEAWRLDLQSHGVWANQPVPMFPYPGSPDYTRRWGLPDDRAWERAHEFYLKQFDDFSDIQEERPIPLVGNDDARKSAVTAWHDNVRAYTPRRNRRFRTSGRLDGRLAAECGRANAGGEVGQRLSRLPLRAVYASPLERAVKTAEVVARPHDLTPGYFKDLGEVDFGEWQGRRFEELQMTSDGGSTISVAPARGLQAASGSAAFRPVWCVVCIA